MMGQTKNDQVNFDFFRFLKTSLQFLKTYFKNPILGMHQIPNWNWKEVLTIQFCLSILCGLLSGVVARKFSAILSGVFYFPFSFTITNFIATGFFYYTFLFFLKREIPFKPLYITLFLANLPFIVLTIISPILKPITLIGLAFSGILLMVGLVENFHLPKKSVARVVLSVCTFYLIIWIAGTINQATKKTNFEELASPESVDILEKELQLNN